MFRLEEENAALDEVAQTVRLALFRHWIIDGTAQTVELKFLHKSETKNILALKLSARVLTSKLSQRDSLNLGRSFTACNEALRDQARPVGTFEMSENQSSRRDEVRCYPAGRP